MPYVVASTGSVSLADCVSCGTGRTSDAGSGGCSDCPVGTFGADAVNPTCQSCPVNTFGDETKMAACKAGWCILKTATHGAQGESLLVPPTRGSVSLGVSLKPVLKAPGFSAWDNNKQLSKFAYNFNLRPYSKACPAGAGSPAGAVQPSACACGDPLMESGYMASGALECACPRGTQIEVGRADTYCSPRHRMPFHAGNESSKCVSMSWRAMGLAYPPRHVVGCHPT